MLEKQEMTARPQHAPDLAERLPGVRNGAERQRAHDGVETIAGEGQVLRVQVVEIDVDARGGDARARVAIEVDVGVDGLDAFDAGRVVREVCASAETHLEDASRRAGQRAPPRRVQHAIGHGLVEQVRKDAVMVEAHVVGAQIDRCRILKPAWTKAQ